jgi:hypothetical protein
MTIWQEVAKCELAEHKEEIGGKRQICLKCEDKVGRISRANSHYGKYSMEHSQYK